MQNLRRSGRPTKRPKYDNEFAPAYPDDEPANKFESCVSTLNQQSFPWKIFSAVDDILVYALFSSKRRVGGYRTVIADCAFSDEEAPITRKEGIEIRKIIGHYSKEEGVQPVEEIRHVAERLVEAVPNVFAVDQLPVIQQYGIF
jgi:hypothetical protein